MASFVYITTNLINMKRYLGKHNGRDASYLGSGTILKRAIKKYGREHFTRTTVCICENDTEAYRIEAELSRAWHVVHNNQWYNTVTGGLGFHSGEEHPLYGKVRTAEHTKKLTEANVGKTQSQASNTKRSATQKGRPLTKEHCSRIQQALKGKPKSFTHRQNLSKAKKGIVGRVGTYQIIFPNGEEKIITNLSKFGEGLGFPRTSLFNVTMGIQPSYKGFQVKKLVNHAH